MTIGRINGNVARSKLLEERAAEGGGGTHLTFDSTMIMHDEEKR